MSVRDWLLAFGSRRQTADLAAVAQRWDLDVACVEGARGGVPRLADDLAEAARTVIDTRGNPPAALLNFGRAKFAGEIENIAEAHELLAQDLPASTTIGPSARAARVWGDKALIARSLTALEVAIPATRPIAPASVAGVADAMRTGDFPCPAIVKVTNLTGGSGMELVEKPADLARVVEYLSATGRRLVVTEFVEGDECSVDLLRLGSQALIYPPGIKRTTDHHLTHADHKVKVNGLIDVPATLARDVERIATVFDLQGFFSVEGVVTSTAPFRWVILEGATRATNNLQLQDISLRCNSFELVCRYLRGEQWVPTERDRALALSIPIYEHHGDASVAAIAPLPWVRQVKLEDLAAMPLSRDSRTRLTVKMDASEALEARLSTLEQATGDVALGARVRMEIERVAKQYAATWVAT